jgi:hypothetical protein
MYYNQSSAPVTIDSVSLVDAHNMRLDGAVVYEMIRYAHPLGYINGWNDEAATVPAAEWAARQEVPGAVIPAELGPIKPAEFPEKKPNVYQIVVIVTKVTPAAAWTTGVTVRYRAADQSFALTLQAGLSIGSSHGPVATSCDQPMRAVAAAWAG